jgi:hypothetical protein
LGKAIDKKKGVEKTALRLGVATTAVGWIVKGLPTSSLMFFFTDNMQKIGHVVTRIPYEKKIYSRFRNTKSLADEYVITREMAYNIGGGLIMIVLGILISQFNLVYIVFIVAALSSLVYLSVR